MSLWSRLWSRLKNSTDQTQQSTPGETDKLQEIEARLRKLQTRERRQSQLLEHMYQELGLKLDSIQSRINADLPLETITSFAESLALYRLNKDQDPALDQIWTKLTQLLQAFDVQLILDQGQEFNDSRHQVCDTHWTPEFRANTILQVVRPGLIIQGQIKRPAIVVINSPEQNEKSSDFEPQTTSEEQI